MFQPIVAPLQPSYGAFYTKMPTMIMLNLIDRLFQGFWHHQLVYFHTITWISQTLDQDPMLNFQCCAGMSSSCAAVLGCASYLSSQPPTLGQGQSPAPEAPEAPPNCAHKSRSSQ